MQAPVPGQLPPVPRVLSAWYVLAETHELRAGAKPLRRSLYGDPIALWRGEDGVAAAVVDRCPHRDVPLSFGQVRGNHLQCGYHGWEFDGQGARKRIPSLLGEADRPGRRVGRFEVREQQGLVWVWATPGAEPDVDPHRFLYADKPEYMTVRMQLQADGSLHSVAENALDVPHTAFLHGGLFRKDSATRNRIQASLRRTTEMVECEYIGEPRPEGLVARLLSPSGGLVTHFDRFVMPCIAEVEYGMGTENHFVNAVALTPVDDHVTRLYSVSSLRTRLPTLLVRPVVQPLALRIFQQDAVVLKLQRDSMQHFGTARYTSTEVDLVGPHILRMLNRAASGGQPSGETYTTVVELEV